MDTISSRPCIPISSPIYRLSERTGPVKFSESIFVIRVVDETTFMTVHSPYQFDTKDIITTVLDT